MSKFWQKKYISKYTGEEIDAAVAKAGDATKVTANPTLAGTESALEGLQVGDTKYKIDNEIPTVTLATTDISSVLTGIIAFLVGGNDTIQRKKFTLTSEESESVRAKFESILNRPNKDAFLMIEGFYSKFSGYIYNNGAFNVFITNILNMGMTSSYTFLNNVQFQINLDDTTVEILVSAQKINIPS